MQFALLLLCLSLPLAAGSVVCYEGDSLSPDSLRKETQETNQCCGWRISIDKDCHGIAVNSTFFDVPNKKSEAYCVFSSHETNKLNCVCCSDGCNQKTSSLNDLLIQSYGRAMADAKPYVEAPASLSTWSVKDNFHCALARLRKELKYGSSIPPSPVQIAMDPKALEEWEKGDPEPKNDWLVAIILLVVLIVLLLILIGGGAAFWFFHNKGKNAVATTKSSKGGSSPGSQAADKSEQPSSKSVKSVAVPSNNLQVFSKLKPLPPPPPSAAKGDDFLSDLKSVQPNVNETDGKGKNKLSQEKRLSQEQKSGDKNKGKK